MACVLAWVGDSTAIAVNMGKQADTLMWSSANHSASSPSEQSRLQQLVRVSRAVGVRGNSKPASETADTTKKSPKPRSGSSASNACPSTGSDEIPSLDKVVSEALEVQDIEVDTEENESPGPLVYKYPAKADIAAAIEREVNLPCSSLQCLTLHYYIS